MKTIKTTLPDVLILDMKRHVDQRGNFWETFNQKTFETLGLNLTFVQDNQCFSREAGTVRGLHFQIEPFAQAKLIRVLQGTILDVIVDLRFGSPAYGKHVAISLDAKNSHQILVPAGFAHGYCTLAPDTEVFYKVTNYYSPEHDKGLLWNDPKLGVSWPLIEKNAVLSDKDKKQPHLDELPPYFRFEADILA